MSKSYCGLLVQFTLLLVQVGGVQPSDTLRSPLARYDKALYEEAWSSAPQMGTTTGELPAALQACNSTQIHVTVSLTDCTFVLSVIKIFSSKPPCACLARCYWLLATYWTG